MIVRLTLLAHDAEPIRASICGFASNNAFVSVVADRNDSSRLMIRSRRREHPTKILGKKIEILESVGTDYKYRAFVDRKTVADLVAKSIENIDYDNFKASVTDPVLEDLYHDFWFKHREIQV